MNSSVIQYRSRNVIPSINMNAKQSPNRSAIMFRNSSAEPPLILLMNNNAALKMSRFAKLSLKKFATLNHLEILMAVPDCKTGVHKCS